MQSLENVTKHVRGDLQLGGVERVDDDALGAQGLRVLEAETSSSRASHEWTSRVHLCRSLRGEAQDHM